MLRSLLFVLLASAGLPAGEDITFAGRDPGPASAEVKDGSLRIGNAVLAAEWRIDGGVLRPVSVTQGLTGAKVDQAGAEVFRLTTQAGAKTPDLAASAFKVDGAPRVVVLSPATGKVSRAADAIRGTAIEVVLAHPSGLRVLWRAEMRDGANHLRQTLDIAGGAAPLPLRGVEIGELRQPGLSVIGGAPGCPVAGAGFFAGVEMPGTSSQVDASGARQAFACDLKVGGSTRYRFGAVLGVAAEGQLRRGFLRYIERERARASQPFLHYNCWYDLGYKLDQAKLVEVVKAFESELTRKRGVPVRSYLVDDGWDDIGKGLWADNLKRFPQGGLPGLRKAIGALGGNVSIWISPLGGYGGAKERTDWARKMGLIPADASLDLSYPKYRDWFEARCLQLMRESGVNAFKWDKAGDGVGPHFMALLDIASHLRRENPSLFINVTVGTWPSPFWLNHIDSTWRNGSADVGWAGKGNDREQWLTFRDGNCRKLFVELSPLYPLNSVMHHGIVHGREFQGERVSKAGPELRNEARSYFANGAMLQELYLTPSMMTAAGWDAVAESAKWAHARADVLRDAHWVGGDPLRLEPYGYAAWAPRMGTLMVRNPDDQRREIELEAGVVFDLPAGVAGDFDLKSPYADQRVKSLSLSRGKAVKVTLEPFEVLVFDAIPRK